LSKKKKQSTRDPTDAGKKRGKDRRTGAALQGLTRIGHGRPFRRGTRLRRSTQPFHKIPLARETYAKNINLTTTTQEKNRIKGAKGDREKKAWESHPYNKKYWGSGLVQKVQ